MRKLLQTFVLSLVVIMSSLVAVAPAVSAARCAPGGSFFGLPTWYKYLDCDRRTGDVTWTGEGRSVVLRIGVAVFEMLLRLAGMVAVFFVIYGGIRYILSQGDANKISAAKSTILNAIIGLLIVLFASQIVSFVAGRILL